ncbi:MAG: NAD(P)-dependent oxidoreductase [Solirubrobacterales bacterium]|nr:NAD(P)-dependent oxidoreductase [Solirubrobacterales bacterium]
MRVLVAGATGAIGRPLVARLLGQGHEVSALARSADRAATLQAAGVQAHVCDVSDPASVLAAVTAATPDVLVHQLTALPQVLDIRRYEQALAPTNRLRAEATPHLMAAARATGVRRVVCQSISFVTAPTGPPVHDEDAPLYLDGPKAFTPAIAATATMERCVTGTPGVEGVVLRYGFFYGPGTAYSFDGGTAGEIRRRRFPIVGAGTGLSSFVHIDDAADATVVALEGGTTGIFNVCDDEPAPMSEWLPAMAQALGVRPPLRLPAWLVRVAAGPHAVHFGTTLRGNSNARFKRTFGWTPAHPDWRAALPAAMAPTDRPHSGPGS